MTHRLSDVSSTTYYEEHVQAFFEDTVAPLTWRRYRRGFWTEFHLVALSSTRAVGPVGIPARSSFQYGQGEREHGGRRFTDLDEAGLAALLWAALWADSGQGGATQMPPVGD